MGREPRPREPMAASIPLLHRASVPHIQTSEGNWHDCANNKRRYEVQGEKRDGPRKHVSATDQISYKFIQLNFAVLVTILPRPRALAPGLNQHGRARFDPLPHPGGLSCRGPSRPRL